jgi:hypothetical protein
MITAGTRERNTQTLDPVRMRMAITVDVDFAAIL